MTYVGIDPGKRGALGIIGGGEALAVPFDQEAYIAQLSALDPRETAVCLEHVGAMPGQGVVSMFHFGESFGFLEGMLTALRIPYELVRPQKWKKVFSVTGDKNSAIAVCKRLFPGVNLLETPRCRKEHDGMAEALLMAEYARRMLGRAEP